MFYNVLIRYFRFCGDIRGEGRGYNERKQRILQRGNCKDTKQNSDKQSFKMYLHFCKRCMGGC